MEVGGVLVALRLLWDFVIYTFFEVGLECTDGMRGGPSGLGRGMRRHGNRNKGNLGGFYGVL